MGRLADRLSAARHDLFVGRVAEQELFRSALAAPELPFYLLYLYGLGGVGKTTLLHEFATLCQSMDIGSALIDARNIEPTPEAFCAALALALGLNAPASPTQFLAAQTQRYVILIDTYELLSPLDGWLREEFLPELPDNTLVVLAGRQPPAKGWRTDSGWQNLMQTLSLRNLSPDESRSYLNRRSVPEKQHRTVLNFTHGHPLALSLVADLFGQQQAQLASPEQPEVQASGYAGIFQPEQAPDIVKVLLEHLVQQVPDETHRTALEACALLRLTTEELLAEMLGGADAHECFEWLRGLSFIEFGSRGIFPHDLTREAIVADLRWRNPDHYAELHRRARNYYAARLQQTTGQDQERILFDYIFLHRNNPVVRPFLEWQESGSLTPGSAHEADIPLLLEMVQQHEGADAARLAAHWFSRQPEGLVVMRDATGQITGFAMMLALHQASQEDINADPATAAAWRYLENHNPLRPGEKATHFRFWMARDTYQSVSSTQSLIFVTSVRHYLTTPGLAYTFFACADADFWTPIFAYADATRLTEAEFEVGGRHYGIYAHDWRLTPPTAWLSLLAERETASEGASTEPVHPTPTLVVLSQKEFTTAVHDALKHFAHPDALRNNALLRSRLLVESVGATASTVERVVALQALLKTICESLQATPREQKFYQAIYHTYLHPAPSQEQAAELMDIPFSTFRRHLKTGVTRVTDILWQREVGSER